uniref:Uncharacterized protein n=1 Tax=Clastoptera arizonana TaxID=38151 RepID=A0A1B6D1Q0_9HEMI
MDVFQRATAVSKDNLDNVYFNFYEILCGRSVKDVAVCRAGDEETIHPNPENRDEVPWAGEYDVLGRTQEEKDEVYRITASLMKMTRQNKVHPTYDEPLTDMLGLTQSERQNVFKTTSELMLKPRVKNICHI